MTITKKTAYHLLKYLIYILLAVDAYQYFQADYEASRHIFSGGFSYEKFVGSFAITIDVTSWLVLLLCFEVETAWLPAERIKGITSWVLHGIRLFCYFFVFSSYYGYISKYLMFTHVLPFDTAALCDLVGTSYTLLQGLDEYLPITPEVCRDMGGTSLLQLEGTKILADLERLQEARFMALVDVIYATTWLLVIAVLELDVYLKERGRLQGWILTASEISKAVLYLILLGGAIFWGVKGEILDFWDSFMWLAAFVLIDLDVFGVTQEEEAGSLT